ncbi:MAG: hypothetical protein ACXVIO_12045 [Candidatus Angelobacter sp.]
MFRRNGEQCKAPAEKGALICHAHAGQMAMAARRERERRAVLAEAVAEMRKRGNPEFEAKDLFVDFKGIQVTLAVMAQALIDGRINCKTAGRLVVELQTFSKLQWMVHRTKTKTLPRMNTDNTDLKEPTRAEDSRLPQISSDERRLSIGKASTTKDTKEHEEASEARPTVVAENAGNAKIVVMRNAERTYIDAERAHGPPGWARAA